jgi:hypothetical protein
MTEASTLLGLSSPLLHGLASSVKEPRAGTTQWLLGQMEYPRAEERKYAVRLELPTMI